MHPTIQGYVDAWKEMYGRAGEQDRLNEIAMRHGRTSALGKVQDSITACLKEKQQLGKCSHGYREACFDITHRVLVMLREEQSK